MYQKVLSEKKLKKSLLDHKISLFSKFMTFLFWKIEFLSKKHLAFLTIDRYDIELDNIKISDKNIVPLGGVQVPEGESFFPLFWNFADFVVKCWVSKKNIVYGNKHHSLTRKIGCRVILQFRINCLASKIVISFCKTYFFSHL